IMVSCCVGGILFFFFFQAEDGIRDYKVTGVQRVLFRSGIADGGGDPLQDLQGGAGQHHGRDAGGLAAAADQRVQPGPGSAVVSRSEERRVGKECRSRWAGWRERNKGRDMEVM